MQSQNKYLSRRRWSLRQLFPDCKIDSLLVWDMNNIFYLSGFTGSEGVLLLSREETILFVDGRYTEQAASETRGVEIRNFTDKIAAIVQTIKNLKLKRVGLEADAVTLGTYNQLAGRLAKDKFIFLTKELRMLRACKDEHEAACMRNAAKIASSAINRVIQQIKPGWTEKEAALQLEIYARKSGAEGLSFETIIAAGKNSSRPHAKPTDRKIKKGDFVVIDFGVRYKGYCSDETCTIAIGKLTDKQKNAYQIVKASHDCALDAIADGVGAAQVDQRARNVFGKKYESYFVHGTGHGVGLDVHEAPRLSSTSEDILKSGMVFTVEPGLYIPGHWGIRIEDTVFLKENSCEKFTKMDKELTIIE
jgi:Xaa-Pro aminopeptidase